MSTFPELVRRNAEIHGDKPAIMTPQGSITHAELDTRSAALAARLGLRKGTRVGLQQRNGIDWAVTASAVMRTGAVLVPLSTLLKPPELEAQLRIADVDFLLPGDDLGVLAGPDGPPVHPEPFVRPADDLCILFTSGSRGAPKGTIHTHGSGLRAVAAGLDARTIGPDDRLYIPSPFFWAGGFSSGLLSAMVAGCTLLTDDATDVDATLDLLERERVTLFRGWPDQAARLAAHHRFADVDLSSLRDGSLPAVLPPDRRPAPGTRASVFGMTETFGTYTAYRLDRDMPEHGRGSNGRVLDGFEVRISDEGEICVRGPNVMRAICGQTRDETFDVDGWYHTGDLGRLDDGWLWFEGRADDMFKVKGATVYPSEVEAALRELPGVKEAHVTELDGQVAALVVTTEPLGAVVAGAKEQLSSFKVPTRWVLSPSSDAVPMTATAKVAKPALQALLREKGVHP